MNGCVNGVETGDQLRNSRFSGIQESESRIQDVFKIFSVSHQALVVISFFVCFKVFKIVFKDYFIENNKNG